MPQYGVTKHFALFWLWHWNLPMISKIDLSKVAKFALIFQFQKLSGRYATFAEIIPAAPWSEREKLLFISGHF